ncbi:hypothetical protein Q5P01_018379 [Channa striata]|uniref:Uncharacterized protein n=1 Tax=Channa striata TaxID=64152 RepID=A0AA88M6I5_CHASR|nr:hypothetical protein Q5P01_018379 [Channa striata]
MSLLIKSRGLKVKRQKGLQIQVFFSQFERPQLPTHKAISKFASYHICFFLCVIFNFLSLHQKENSKHGNHPSPHEPTTQSASALISPKQSLLHSDDWYSPLTLLCVVSEAFNHHGDHITEEIIVLLPAAAPVASGPRRTLSL